MGNAKRRAERGDQDLTRELALTGIERFTLIKWCHVFPSKDDASDRSDLIDQLVAGEEDWDWDRALGLQKLPVSEFDEEYALTFTKSTLRFAQAFIDALDKGMPQSGVLVDGGSMRYLIRLRDRMRDAVMRKPEVLKKAANGLTDHAVDTDA